MTQIVKTESGFRIYSKGIEFDYIDIEDVQYDYYRSHLIIYLNVVPIRIDLYDFTKDQYMQLGEDMAQLSNRLKNIQENKVLDKSIKTD